MFKTTSVNRYLLHWYDHETLHRQSAAVRFVAGIRCVTPWRATDITIYLENDGRLEHAHQMAGHESPRTMKLYDRTKDED